jgi:hypothetical protein
MKEESVDIATFLLEIADESKNCKDFRGRGCEWRKKCVHKICKAVGMFWEATLDGDARWQKLGVLNLAGVSLNRCAKRVRATGSFKMALANEYLNISGTGVNSVRQLAVGMAVQKREGPNRRRPREPWCEDGSAASQKKRKVDGALPEATCRDVEKYYVYNYHMGARTDCAVATVCIICGRGWHSAAACLTGCSPVLALVACGKGVCLHFGGRAALRSLPCSRGKRSCPCPTSG